MPKGNSGGRRGGGGGGGGGVLPNLPQAVKQLIQAYKSLKKNNNSSALQGDTTPDYNDNGNPQLVKWQGQTDDKAAKFLAKLNNEVDLNDPQYKDKWDYYEGSYQKFVLALGLNKKPLVLDEKTFDALQQATGAQLIYRGERSQDQCDRFMDGDFSHTGVGSYGDGFYFATDTGTANGYANSKGGANGRVMKMMLAPSARIGDYWNIKRAVQQGTNGNLQRGLLKAGQSAQGASYSNEGQAQMALKMGYNVVDIGSGWAYGCTRDAFIVCKTTKHSW